MEIEKILQYVASPVNSGKYVCLDTATHAGPMVEAKEWASLVRIAKRLDRIDHLYWKADGRVVDCLKEMRWHLAQRSLTDAIERRINVRTARWEMRRADYGKQVAAIRSEIAALIAASKTLQPLAR